LAFGCFNIRSLANKLDDLLEVRCDKLLDVIFLVETWHDSDSVSLGRLRADGFQVVDRPRPRSRLDTLATNHGGIDVVAVQGMWLGKIDIGVIPSTFELLVVRVVSHQYSCVAAVIYRPGSAAVTPLYFSELSDVLDRIATFVDPVLLVGDVNIHLEVPTNANTAQFVDVLAAHGLVSRVTSATHDLGGILDVVASRVDLLSPDIDVLEVGLSNH